MKKKIDKTQISNGIILICFMVFVGLEFALHRKVVFMMDDLWYATNLSTGEPLSSIWDVFQSQAWHFMNWGGRSISHGVLQLVLMSGELCADILNMIVTFTLSYLICELADTKKLVSFCTVFFLLISLNGDVKLSMFWQAGSANYLYCTNWILLFVFVFMRQVKQPQAKALKGISFWILPLGLISGWSNENMGPASFVLTLMVIVYFVRFLKRKVPLWMWLGSAAALCGSILVVVAPGNFVRSAFAEESPFAVAVYKRFLMMLEAGTDVLFPTVLFVLLFMLLYRKTGNKLQPFQILLLIMAVLAYGAMFLSPTFPRRAAFGIMILGIVLIQSFIRGIREADSGYDNWLFAFSILMWLFGVHVLCMELTVPITA